MNPSQADDADGLTAPISLHELDSIR